MLRSSNASKVPSVAPVQSRKKAFDPFKKLLEEKARQDEFKKVHVRLVESRPSSGDEATDDEHAGPPTHTGMDRQSDFIQGIDSNLGLGVSCALWISYLSFHPPSSTLLSLTSHLVCGSKSFSDLF